MCVYVCVSLSECVCGYVNGCAMHVCDCVIVFVCEYVRD